MGMDAYVTLYFPSVDGGTNEKIIGGVRSYDIKDGIFTMVYEKLDIDSKELYLSTYIIAIDKVQHIEIEIVE
jgi:hypothetical protein